jgi:hypothetical protein
MNGLFLSAKKTRARLSSTGGLSGETLGKPNMERPIVFLNFLFGKKKIRKYNGEGIINSLRFKKKLDRQTKTNLKKY